MSVVIAHSSAGRTLVDLAETINSEYRATLSHFHSALQHAISCGDALLMAREHIGPTGWDDWCAANIEPSPHHAGCFMRLAHYKERLPPEAFVPYRSTAGHLLQPSANRAMQYLRGLPPITKVTGRTIPQETKAEIKRLHKEGVSGNQIALILGLASSTVWAILNPEKAQALQKRTRQLDRERRRAWREQKKLKEAQAFARLAAKPGDLADAYALVRQALQKLDGVRATTPASRRAVRKATSMLHGAEDAIGYALRNDVGAA